MVVQLELSSEVPMFLPMILLYRSPGMATMCKLASATLAGFCKNFMDSCDKRRSCGNPFVRQTLPSLSCPWLGSNRLSQNSPQKGSKRIRKLLSWRCVRTFKELLVSQQNTSSNACCLEALRWPSCSSKVRLHPAVHEMIFSGKRKLHAPKSVTRIQLAYPLSN